MGRSLPAMITGLLCASQAAGCGEPPPPPSAATRVEAATCAAAWTPGAGSPIPEPVELFDNPWSLPLTVTGVADSPYGAVVAGVSDEEELWWDAWLVPAGGQPPRRLAPVGDTLLTVGAAGALWTTVASIDDAGETAYEVRLSPAGGGPSLLVAPGLPPDFAAERALSDGGGGWLLAGSELLADRAAHASVFAVDARGAATRLACDPTPDAPLILDARLAVDELRLTVQYAAMGAPEVITVARERRPGRPRSP